MAVMNRYEHALGIVKEIETNHQNENLFGHKKSTVYQFKTSEIDVLQILVDKSVQMQIKRNPYGIAFCPVCRGSVFQDREYTKYCFRCGQALLW